MNTDKGRWFRVYAVQMRDHPKFRGLTGLEVGAWTTLRSEAELRVGAVIADRDEAVLILKRRKIPRPAGMLDRLIGLCLFDVDPDGRIHVHDRDDHDRQSVGQQSHRRDHRRSEPEPGCEWCVVERWDRSANINGAWVDRVDVGGTVDTSTTVERGQPQPSAPATANSPQPQPIGAGLPDIDDSATAACRLFINGGSWLSNDEYIEAWEELDRRFGDWVKPAIQPAYGRLHDVNPKVKPWSLLRATEMALAERARTEDLERERAEVEASAAERKRLAEKAAAATEDDKRRASVMRRAVGLWIKRRPSDPVPTDFDELESWLKTNGASA